MGRESSNQYDVIVVGAGMIGAAMACLLAKQSRDYQSGPLKIALVEARPAPEFNTERFDPRVAALTEKSRQLMERCGVWDATAAKRVNPYLAMEVWDAEGTGRIQFDCHDIHQPCLGHIVENSALVEALLTEIAEAGSVDMFCPSLIADYGNTDQGISIELQDGTHLSGDLLVAADGANSAIRKHFIFETVEWDYGHQAIVTTIRTEQPNQQTAWQRFMPTGPLALLPLNNQGDQHHCSIVWSQKTELAEGLVALDDQQFCAELSRASEHCLGQVVEVEQRFSIPLRQRHAKDYVIPRVVLVGDAAHSIHPLAGQGANLGFSDIDVLAEEIARAVERDIDLGDLSVLKRYQRRRKPENLATMAAMEGFKRLFAADPPAVRLLRNMGMSTLNEISPVKNQLIKIAMGL
ncbi:MAG: UbiH/UbiF/VisC/COQ6 family ubiquinone biosynthesis hydroxylase [Porticoccaceae bacterium]|jgi:2-polyprenylphenol 6-hydroxylase|nr:UbiH/UbiF/VisC/COQ6 family ubiquinone biosynthesis hydroxylase [Porticoccaceae bacterium]